MPTIEGTSGNDTLTGTDAADAINGLAGDDTLNGGAGNDTLDGGDGNDHIDGGDGSDQLTGGLGNDTLIGRGGIGNVDVAVFVGNFADYRIVTGSTTTITGLGSRAADGTDSLRGIELVRFADVTVSLGINPNNPPVRGYPEMVDQAVDDGSNYTYQVPASSFIELDDTPLTFTASLADGSALPTWLSFDGSTRTFTGVPPVSVAGTTYDIVVTAADQFSDPEEDFGDYQVSDNFLLTINLAGGPDIYGTDGDDILRGTFRQETLIGLNGNDRIYGSALADRLDGGAGTDTVDFSESPQGVTVNLSNGSAAGGDAEGDLLISFEAVIGSAFGDRLTGTLGADTIVGGDGNDELIGGGGADLLTGGDGFDTAVYSALFRAYNVAASGVSGTVSGGAEGGTDALTSIEVVQFKDGKFVFDVDGVAAQVTRLYDTVLQRGPDQVGLDYHVDRLEDHGGTLKQIATGFLDSPEFQAATGNLSNAAYVEYLYQQALGRASDPAGMDYYVSRLASGELDRADLLVGFSESPEHRGLTAALVDQGFFNTDDIYQAVALLYDTFAGRLPDAAGLIYYAELIKTGALTLDQAADNFAASPEFRALTDGMSNTQLVNFMYQNTLDRPAEEAGLAYWNARLEAGIDRGDLLLGFSQSEEHFVLLGEHVTNGIDYL